MKVHQKNDTKEKREFLKEYFNSNRQLSNAIYPLSPGQEMLWRSHHFSDNQNHLNMFSALKLPRDVNLEVLKMSFQHLVDKHEALRTNFITIKGKVYQYIHAKQTVSFIYEDFYHRKKAEVDKRLSYLAHKSFDLEKDPLLQLTVIKNNTNDYILLFNVHHLVIDGWSIIVLLQELGQIYNSFISTNKSQPRVEVDDTYRKFVRKERSQMKEQDLKANPITTYWLKEIRDGEEVKPVHLVSENNPSQSYTGKSLYSKLDEEMYNRIKKVARNNRTTISNVLLSGLYALLYRYSGQQHLWINMPFSRRDDISYFNSVGYFVNSLPIYSKVNGYHSYKDLLSHVSKKVTNALAHQDISYTHLQNMKKESQMNTNINFSYQDFNNLKDTQLGLVFLGVEDAKGKIGPLTIEVYPLMRRVTQFEVELEIVEYNQELHFRILYDPILYEQLTMERFCNHYKNLLNEMVSNTNKYIIDYSLLTEEEMDEQLQNFNHNEVIIPDKDASVLELVNKIVLEKPNDFAAISDGESITYKELQNKSTNIAINLQSLGLQKEERIGLCMGRSIDLIISILGILKAGAVYVPIDPQYPAERVNYMLSDSEISYIITDKDYSALKDTKARKLKTQQLLEKKSNTLNLPIVSKSSMSLAYVIYTSGSTGKPKGVMVNHGNLYASTYARTYVYEKDDVRFLLLSSISFDSSLVGIFWTLMIGGTIVLPKNNDLIDMTELKESIVNHKVTHLLSVPSFVYLLLNQADNEELRSLKTLIVAGEQFPNKLQKLQQEKYPKLTIYNEYGPSEGTVWASVHRLNDRLYSRIPIGYPTKHTKLYILDEALNLVPKGVIGELYLSGSGVTRGYNNQKKITAERYIPNPFEEGTRLYRTLDLAKYNLDGTIQYIGRIDNQIKLNGFRIELGEIDVVYEKHPFIQKVVTIYKKDKGAQLIAFFTSNKEIPDEELQEYGAKLMPHYHIPHHFVRIEEFPLNQNGKIDRKKLHSWKLDKKQETIQLARNEIEKLLVQIFQQVLNIDKVSIHDNFFELGGDSIIAIQIAAKLNEHQLQAKPKDIFDNRTISRIAKQVVPIQENNFLAENNLEGTVPLTPIQHWFFNQNFNNPNHWNQALHLKIDKSISVSIVQKVMIRILNTHKTLRLRFMEIDNQWTQKYMNNDKSSLIIKKVTNSGSENNLSILVQEFQGMLDIRNGPTVLAAIVENDDVGKRNDLIIIIHHLLVDVVSWQIIMTDLERMIGNLMDKKEINPVHPTTSYKKWSTHLLDSIDHVKDERKYWGKITQMIENSGNFSSYTGTEASSRRLELPLGEHWTNHLLKEVPKYFRTKVNEVILSAITLALKKFMNQEQIVFDIEHHGRVPFYEDIDLSHSVGWFTNIYPLPIHLLNYEEANIELLKHVKNIIREVPNDGLGFGMLNYLQSQKTDNGSGSKKPLFSYNFLGQIDNTFFHSKYFSFEGYLSDSIRNRNEKRPYLIDFEPYITKGNFILRIGYSAYLHEEKEINELAMNILKHLKRLIHLCMTSEKAGYVSNDFPNANISQENLENLLSRLKKN